jgi:23S rRNA (adenine1618-N6)-methyltransferase
MEKSKGLHKKNIHNQPYDFKKLIETQPDLKKYIIINKYQNESIDFSDQKSVMALNQALLAHFYNIKSWSIPTGHLCPPIPGRADYIHYISDLLDLSKENKGLDIGTGTGCIYPVLGVSLYNMKFVATDIDKKSLAYSKEIINSNISLQDNIELRQQSNSSHIFKNIINPDDSFDFTICNPPFHTSLEEANKGSQRKRKNLNKNKEKKNHKLNTSEDLNFGGKNAELWCAGGEIVFITTMINESVLYKENCKLFTTLVSKKSNLEYFYKVLKRVNAKDVRAIEMQHGQKSSHILVWKFN